MVTQGRLLRLVTTDSEPGIYIYIYIHLYTFYIRLYTIYISTHILYIYIDRENDIDI